MSVQAEVIEARRTIAVTALAAITALTASCGGGRVICDDAPYAYTLTSSP
jgi:hypothetical protein